MKYGYTHEKTHAFFPGYPMLLNFIYKYLDYGYFLLGSDPTAKDLVPLTTSFWMLTIGIQIGISSANTYLIYKQGKKLLSLPFFGQIIKDHKLISFGAAALYAFNQSFIYTIAPYSDSLYLFF